MKRDVVVGAHQSQQQLGGEPDMLPMRPQIAVAYYVAMDIIEDASNVRERCTTKTKEDAGLCQEGGVPNHQDGS